MENPYATPQTTASALVPDAESDEAIRNAHLKHEASVKAVGFLYILGGIIVAVYVVSIIIAISQEDGRIREALIGTIGVGAVMGVASLVIGFGIRRLKPWSRIAAAIIAAIGLLGFPLGTLINAYILYLVLSKKGKMVFSPRYAEIMRATPHIRYRTPVWLWILLGGFVVLVLALFVFALLAGRR